MVGAEVGSIRHRLGSLGKQNLESKIAGLPSSRSKKPLCCFSCRYQWKCLHYFFATGIPATEATVPGVIVGVEAVTNDRYTSLANSVVRPAWPQVEEALVLLQLLISMEVLTLLLVVGATTAPGINEHKKNTGYQGAPKEYGVLRNTSRIWGVREHKKDKHLTLALPPAAGPVAENPAVCRYSCTIRDQPSSIESFYGSGQHRH
ncbi:hypothetical protein ANO14919_071700 [Xylariales sp. No.14919]|nr:hypothetical protein ANO14919_071700 [Xylariales sp. No.14919]